MRLTEFEILSIKNAVSLYLKEYELFLFGSRVDDLAKGGDIDLMILTEEKYSMQTKWTIRNEIEKRIGEQKIDIVNFAYNENNPFKDFIIETAVKL